MCGFAGFLGFDSKQLHEVKSVGLKMGKAINHRGPDGQGLWIDTEAEACLSHRRLAVIDVTEAGAQPMSSPSGRYVIAFNGEIYNHLDLRAQIESRIEGAGVSWKGYSDTETLLTAIETWGFVGALKRLTGMFGLAVWDRKEQKLLLARDRMGEKPLFYGWQSGVFIFGSDLAALRNHPAFENRINRQSIGLQMRHSYVPDPYSIYENIFKLKPGHYLEVSRQSARRNSEPIAYWSYNEVLEKGITEPFEGDEKQAILELDEVLRASVKRQMLSDVPLGAFLSGGTDSSLIVSMLQSMSSSRIMTFTIGFHEDEYNEAKYAKDIAEFLGTNHSEFYVTAEEAMAVIPKLPNIYSEPFSDVSQIPTFLVSQLARKDVTVALSGDGGDELFYGYDRYTMAAKYWRRLAYIPFVLRTIIAQVPSLANKLRGKGGKVQSLLVQKDGESFYRLMHAHWIEKDSLMARTDDYFPFDLAPGPVGQGGLEEYMMQNDALGYLPGDILTKVDRAAMANSLETRVPLLDHHVVKFACHLPQNMKMRDGRQKWILKEVLKNYIPTHLTERPKKGFGVPIDKWLRGPLREWGEELLCESKLKNQGFFNASVVRKKWDDHLSGRSQQHYYLWDVLMFQAWLEGERNRLEDGKI